MALWIDALDTRCVAITRRIAFVGVLGMLAVSLLTALDITLRAVFNAPIVAFNEVVVMVMAVAIAATFPAGFAQRSHLTIDLVGRALGARARAWLVPFGSFLLLLLFVLFAWRMGVFASDLQARGQTTMILEWPLAPFLWAICVFFALGVPVQFVVVLTELRDALAGNRAAPDVEPPAVADRTMVLVALGVAVLAALCVLGYGDFVSGLKFILPDEPGAVALILFAAMWGMILVLIPLAAAMGLVGVTGTALVLGFYPALDVLGSETAEFLTNYNLAVLPLFLMMGSFASVAGLSSDIYGLAHAIVGHRRGGLGLATVCGCAGFGALTGSSLATAITIGRVALPEMRERGYSPDLATGCVAAGGTLGQLVPPSGAIIIFAILVEESIGRLFIAAIVPAAVAVILYMITVSVYVRVVPASAPGTGRPDFREMRLALRRSALALALFGVVIGGIYGGIFTATEAAAVGVGGAFLIALLRGKLGAGAFWQVMGETTATTAMVYVLILGAVNFSFFIGAAGMPDALTAFVDGLDLSRYGVIALLLLIYLIMGAVMDPFAMMVITVPIVTPLITDMGFDIIWWGIIMVSVVETGLITPPFGINVFVLKSIVPDVPLPTIFRGVLPFVVADIVRLVVLVAFPALVLWLPSTMIN